MPSPAITDDLTDLWSTCQTTPIERLDVPTVVDRMLLEAREAGASDVHCQPNGTGYTILQRVDGVLQPWAEISRSIGERICTRLKVMAGLLTYETAVPQEGRIRVAADGDETRISSFPTLYGERIVVRLFTGSGRYRLLNDLGLPAEVESSLRTGLAETGGILLLTGPAGSGKTTTAYACLRELVRESQGSRCIMSLEDPVEVVIPGVSQSQVHPPSGFDLATGLKSLLRQDPEVIFVGEIRDPTTARTVFEASLAGHLVITTFHAGSAAEAISRLSDMGIEPYLLRSGILSIVCQRLMRQLCSCAVGSTSADDLMGFRLAECRLASGCSQCGQTGYSGRFLIAEMLQPGNSELAEAVLQRRPRGEIQQIAETAGMVSLGQRAFEAICKGQTSPAEVRRVLGAERSNPRYEHQTSQQNRENFP